MGIKRMLDHPNIVKLVGICKKPLRIVMEFITGGDLHHLIRKEQTNSEGGKYFEPLAEKLPWKLRYLIMLDIAKGMKYLFGRDIIHRDLRSPNIFIITTEVSNSRRAIYAKVADFGLSVPLPSATGNLRSWRWLAPEVFHYSSTRHDIRSDIYSFAVVCWELIQGTFPFGTFTFYSFPFQHPLLFFPSSLSLHPPHSLPLPPSLPSLPSPSPPFLLHLFPSYFLSFSLPFAFLLPLLPFPILTRS